MKQKSKSAAVNRTSSKKNNGQVLQSMPAITDLLRDCWLMVTNRFGTLLGLTLLKGFVELSILVVGVLAGLFAGGTALVTAYQQGLSLADALSPELLRAFISIGVVAFLAIMIESLLTQVMLLRVLFNQEEGLMTAFRRSVSSFWSMLAVAGLVAVISLGGLSLFVLPGIVFSIWFIFAMYELVLYQTPVLLSLERSAATVRSHFWGIFGRVLVFGILTSILGTAFDEIAKSISPDLQLFVMFASLLYQALIGWMSVAYIGTLYRSVRVQTIAYQSVKTSMIISGIGWLLVILLTLGITKNLKGELLNPATFLSETGLFSESMVEKLLPGDDLQAPFDVMGNEPTLPEEPSF